LTKTEYVEIKKEGIGEHLKREKNGQTARCKMCHSVLTLLAARRRDCTSTSLSTVHVELVIGGW